ncbi:hypothetical protein ACFYZ5_43695 [Streptomyces chartreusis]|uniref:hypothetical protein n=1 Tax=Streptomyces chartreusis TaxID=1969 RepID=UPI0036836EEA
MRILRHLAKQTVRSRPADVSKLMAYIPTAVTTGYLREPDTEIPLPGHEFARRINTLLGAADGPYIWDSRPRRSTASPYTSPDTRSVDREPKKTIPEQMGTAKR